MSESTPLLNYHAASFSAGRMDFAWEELSDEEARPGLRRLGGGQGLIGGDPRRRPNPSHLLPAWASTVRFSALALDDARGQNGSAAGAARLDRPEAEIGFGRGDFLLDRAYPDTLFLGDKDQGDAPVCSASSVTPSTTCG